MMAFGVWRWNVAKGGMRFPFPPYGPKALLGYNLFVINPSNAQAEPRPHSFPSRRLGTRNGRNQPAPGPLFLLAPHPKGEVAGPGAGAELGQLSFELGNFGLEGLGGRGLRLELVDLTA
jgi:hypothetical protein